jgi:hypothetical protein
MKKKRWSKAPGKKGEGGTDAQERERLLEECEEAVERLLEEKIRKGGSFADYEKAILEIVHEVARRKLERKLQGMADQYPDRIAIEHSTDWHGLRDEGPRAYRRHASGRVAYHSLVGSLRVTRHTYRECYRNGVTYVPLELDAMLMEHMTPALAKATAIGYAYMPARQCEQFMIASGLKPPSRSTLDRNARDLGAYAVAANKHIEPLVRSNELVPADTCSIAVGLDRTAVPMRPGERHETCYEPDLRRSRPKTRSRVHGAVEWRMDYVGTVSMLDAEGKALATRTYRLPGEAEPATIVERMVADLRQYLGHRPVPVAVVQDGARELWKVVGDALSAEAVVGSWTEVLDWFHLDERLGKCLDLCALGPKERQSQRKRWHAQLLETDDGIRPVIRSLRRKARAAGGDVAAELRQHIDYFRRNKKRSRYRCYKARGLPIGSGITEGACKSVVGARAKRSGQRWSQRGLTAALHLRAIHQSDRFDAFWSFFTRRYRAKNIVQLGS